MEHTIIVYERGHEKRITTWFGNNVSKRDGSETPKPKHGKLFTIRDVIRNTRKEDIHKLIAKETNAPAGHKDWLPHYPAALTQVLDGLTEAEMEEAEKEVKKWNSRNDVPREVQIQ